MRLRLSPEAQRGLRVLPPGPKQSMRAAFQSLAQDPSGQGLDVKPLRFGGDLDIHRLRIGSFRATFVIRRGEVLVLDVFARSRGYRWLEERYG